MIKYFTVALALFPLLAQGHISTIPSSLPAGSKNQVVSFRVSHACSNTTVTTGISIALPPAAQVTAFKARARDGWGSSVKLGSFANFTNAAGGGAGIANNVFVDFDFQVSIASTVAAGTKFTFNTVQFCQDGTSKNWFDSDSPLLTVTAAAAAPGPKDDDDDDHHDKEDGPHKGPEAIAIAGLVISIVALLLAFLIIIKINAMNANTIQPNKAPEAAV